MATEVERLIVTLEANLAKYNADLTKAQTVTNQRVAAMEGRFNGLSRSTSAAAGSVTGLGAALGTIGAYLSASQVQAYADSWTRVERSISGTEQTFNIALKSADQLTELANDSRIDLESYSKLYQRTAAAIRDYGLEAGAAEDVTSTLAKALKLGAATGAEQASVITQFSQALQKGKLDGDEFRTVMENAGVVQELLAKRLGVTKGRIIELAAAGKLQIRDLVGAMRDGKDQIDRIFRGLPSTIDESFVVLSNSVTRYVGGLDKVFGITTKVTGVTAVLARNIETVGDVALVTAAALLAMAAPRLLGSIAGIGLAATAAVGPVGLLLATIAGSATAYTAWQNNLEDVGGVLVSVKDKVDGLRVAIDEANRTRINVKVDTPSTMEGFGVDGDAQTGDVSADAARYARQIAIGRGFAANTKTKLGDGKKKVDASGSGDKKNPYERETEQIKKKIEATLAEAKVVGENTVVQERARAQQELLTAARQAEMEITPQLLASIDELSRGYGNAVGQVAYLRALQGEREATQVVRDEIELVGKFGYELARARVEQQLLNEAKKAGQELTPARLAEIDAIARERAGQEQLKEALREIGDVSKDSLKGFIADLRDGKSAAEALGGVLGKISDRLLDMAVNGLVDQALGSLVKGGTTGGGGILGSILGSVSGGGTGVGPFTTTVTPFAMGGVAANGRALPKFAGGGVSRSAAIFGEAGPEAAVPLPDGRRIPVELRMPSAVAPSALQSGAVSVTVSPVFNIQNGTPEGIDKLRGEIVPLMRQVAKTEIATLFDRNAKFAKMRR